MMESEWRAESKDAIGAGDAVSILAVEGATLKVEDLSSGKPVTLATVAELPTGSDYVVGNFRGAGVSDLVFYKSGESTLTYRSVEEAGGKVTGMDGGAWDPDGGHILATNGLIHEEVLKIIS